MEFKLQAPYKPTGDQPEAIRQLVEGIDHGYKDQVLLGATGTGKSLGYEDPVFVIEKCGLDQVERLLPIGEWIDALMAQDPVSNHREGDSTVLDIQPGQVEYFAQSFDPQTRQVELYPIRSVVRHAAPTEMFRLETACGRSATLTGDHNLWVLREGQLCLIRT